MNDSKQFAELIKDFKKVYGAGGIQHRKFADGWRQDLNIFFDKNDKEFLNPVADNDKIFNPSVMGYKKDGSIYTLEELLKVDEEKRAMLLKQTEENDMYFIGESDLVIFYIDSTAGFGTMTEFRENADEFKKPFMIVRTIARNALPHWIEQRRYFALMVKKTAIEFKSLTELKKYFIDYLGFKE